jgi:NAD-dependent aldehyde dehydrogenases
MPGTERGVLIYRLTDLIEEQKEIIATIEAWDSGKPFGVALNADVAGTIATLRYYAGWADKLHAQTIPRTSQKFAYTLRQPVGVCGQIIP